MPQGVSNIIDTKSKGKFEKLPQSSGMYMKIMLLLNIYKKTIFIISFSFYIFLVYHLF